MMVGYYGMKNHPAVFPDGISCVFAKVFNDPLEEGIIQLGPDGFFRQIQQVFNVCRSPVSDIVQTVGQYARKIGLLEGGFRADF